MAQLQLQKHYEVGTSHTKIADSEIQHQTQIEREIQVQTKLEVQGNQARQWMKNK